MSLRIYLSLALLFAIAAGNLHAAEKLTAREAMNASASEGKFTFLLFYKQSDATSNAMNAALKEAVAKYPQNVSVVPVQVGNPDNEAIVKKFDVARAPMPLTA